MLIVVVVAVVVFVGGEIDVKQWNRGGQEMIF